jgi:hypothetical protein
VVRQSHAKVVIDEIESFTDKREPVAAGYHREISIRFPVYIGWLGYCHVRLPAFFSTDAQLILFS